MPALFASGFSILALGAYIYITRRAAGGQNAPGLSPGYKVCLGAVFVAAALSAAATGAVLLALAQDLVLAFLATGETAWSGIRPWTVTASYITANGLTALVFHRSVSRYFRRLAKSASVRERGG